MGFKFSPPHQPGELAPISDVLVNSAAYRAGLRNGMNLALIPSIQTGLSR